MRISDHLLQQVSVIVCTATSARTTLRTSRARSRRSAAGAAGTPPRRGQPTVGPQRGGRCRQDWPRSRATSHCFPAGPLILPRRPAPRPRPAGRPTPAGSCSNRRQPMSRGQIGRVGERAELLKAVRARPAYPSAQSKQARVRLAMTFDSRSRSLPLRRQPRRPPRAVGHLCRPASGCRQATPGAVPG